MRGREEDCPLVFDLLLCKFRKKKAVKKKTIV